MNTPLKRLRKKLGLAFGSTLLCIALGSGAVAGSGGGEVPFPFGTLNAKVELADGEFYLLIGKVILLGSGSNVQAYLSVDLDQHPWLANGRRKASPIYPLDRDAGFWRRYEGQTVKLTALARGSIVYGEDRQPHWVISLERQIETANQGCEIWERSSF